MHNGQNLRPEPARKNTAFVMVVKCSESSETQGRKEVLSRNFKPCVGKMKSASQYIKTGQVRLTCQNEATISVQSLGQGFVEIPNLSRTDVS